MESVALTAEEVARYQWQLWVAGFGEEGQRRLKGASVLVSRVGGVGGALAYQLAAAGVGRLILAHAGPLRIDDLNRQILMAHAGLGRPRIELARKRLLELNPGLVVEVVGENIGAGNVDDLVGRADAVASCAPLFEERLQLNGAAVRQGKPLVDAAMFELEGQLTTVLPGRTPCLGCLYPEAPVGWRRQFPVFGAVAGTLGALGAMEVIKVLTGLGEPLLGQLLVCDLGSMDFRKVRIAKRDDCGVCGGVSRINDAPGAVKG